MEVKIDADELCELKRMAKWSGSISMYGSALKEDNRLLRARVNELLKERDWWKNEALGWAKTCDRRAAGIRGEMFCWVDDCASSLERAAAEAGYDG